LAIPRKDSELVPYVGNFSAKLTAQPVLYGQTAIVATAVDAAADAYVAAYNALATARANGTRSAVQTATKDDTRVDLLKLIRPIYNYVQSSTINDADKIALGVSPRGQYTPQNPPAFAPQLVIAKVDGCVVTARVRDSQEPDRKGLPPGVDGVSVFSYTGPVAPLDPAAYVFQGNTGKSTITVEFPGTLTPGTKVWLIAFFFNRRKESSPACMPVDATINYPSSLPMAA
jgi:hypothetical protein